MEPTQQGVPVDPSSSQQQPEPRPPLRRLPPHPPLSMLPPDQRAVQRPQAPQHLPPAALPQLLAVQHPRLPRLPLPQGLALDAADGVPWQPQGPQQLEGPSLHLSMPQPHFYGHIPGVGAAIPFSGSAFLSADQVEPRSRSWEPAIGRQLTLQDRRALWDFCHLVLDDVGFADSSACVVRLLREGREDVRIVVFNGVMGALQFVMSSKWNVVFLELLLARRYYELQRIVHAACGEVSLTYVAYSQHGVASLASLFRAVRLQPNLRQDLINWLLNEEGLFQHNKFLGNFGSKKVLDLLHRLFTTFPGEDCRVVTRYALETWDGATISSEFQSMFLMECCVSARDAELQEFEGIILSRTIELAMGRYSNIFLEHVLLRCRHELREEIATRVLENLVNLSMHEWGKFVVQACFLPTGQGPLLQRVLTAFLALHDEQLAQLVPDLNAYCVLKKLLGIGKHDSPEETRALALRIQNLEVAGEIARLMKELVAKVLAES